MDHGSDLYELASDVRHGSDLYELVSVYELVSAVSWNMGLSCMSL